jgi:hypothetical protein
MARDHADHFAPHFPFAHEGHAPYVQDALTIVQQAFVYAGYLQFNTRLIPFSAWLQLRPLIAQRRPDSRHLTYVRKVPEHGVPSRSRGSLSLTDSMKARTHSRSIPGSRMPTDGRPLPMAGFYRGKRFRWVGSSVVFYTYGIPREVTQETSSYLACAWGVLPHCARSRTYAAS